MQNRVFLRDPRGQGAITLSQPSMAPPAGKQKIDPCIMKCKSLGKAIFVLVLPFGTCAGDAIRLVGAGGGGNGMGRRIIAKKSAKCGLHFKTDFSAQKILDIT